MPLNQKKTWVVTSNTNTCRIYNYSIKPTQLTLIKEMQHPENRMRDIDLTADKPGRYKASGSALSSFTQASDPKEIKIDDFSREIAKDLEHNRNHHEYQTLIIIAPPHMNGLLFQHINKNVELLVTHNIEKDLMHLSNHEIRNGPMLYSMHR